VLKEIRRNLLRSGKLTKKEITQATGPKLAEVAQINKVKIDKKSVALRQADKEGNRPVYRLEACPGE